MNCSPCHRAPCILLTVFVFLLVFAGWPAAAFAGDYVAAFETSQATLNADQTVRASGGTVVRLLGGNYALISISASGAGDLAGKSDVEWVSADARLTADDAIEFMPCNVATDKTAVDDILQGQSTVMFSEVVEGVAALGYEVTGPTIGADSCIDPSNSATACDDECFCIGAMPYIIDCEDDCIEGYLKWTVGPTTRCQDAAVLTPAPGPCASNCTDEGVVQSQSTSGTCCTVTKTRQCTRTCTNTGT